MLADEGATASGIRSYPQDSLKKRELLPAKSQACEEANPFEGHRLRDCGSFVRGGRGSPPTSEKDGVLEMVEADTTIEEDHADEKKTAAVIKLLTKGPNSKQVKRGAVDPRYEGDSCENKAGAFPFRAFRVKIIWPISRLSGILWLISDKGMEKI